MNLITRIFNWTTYCKYNPKTKIWSKHYRLLRFFKRIIKRKEVS